MALKAAKVTQTLNEKRYNTLNLLEASFQHGSETNIYPVLNADISDLGAETFEYNMNNPVNTYVIFNERPKPYLLQKYGWYKEGTEIIPILAYIPTHLLYNKVVTGEPGEEVTTYTIANETALLGDEVLEIVTTGESDDHILQHLKITRGAIIDIKYDFLSYNNMDERISRFYVVDAKVDLVSLNYIANLMPYKYKLPDEGAEDSNFKKINYDSDNDTI